MVAREPYNIPGTTKSIRWCGREDLNLLTPDGATLYANRAALDGKGIDAKIFNAGMRAGHHGMPGMHERAKLAGGKLTVSSAQHSGTEIELTIPAALAYVKAFPSAQTTA